MKYFYYVRWWLPEGELPEGLYHSTFITDDKPKDFLSGVVDTEFIGEYYLKQFKTEEEMRAYWELQSATLSPSPSS